MRLGTLEPEKRRPASVRGKSAGSPVAVPQKARSVPEAGLGKAGDFGLWILDRGSGLRQAQPGESRGFRGWARIGGRFSKNGRRGGGEGDETLYTYVRRCANGRQK